MPSNPERDARIDVVSRELLKSELFLQNMAKENPRKALKMALRAAGNLVDGKPHGLPLL